MLSLMLKAAMRRKKSRSVLSLILSGRYCAGSNPMQFFPRGSRQPCISKNLVKCCLNSLGTTLHRSKLNEMLFERLQTALHRKSLAQCCLNTPGTTLRRKKNHQHTMLPLRLQTTMNRKKSCLMLSLILVGKHCTGQNSMQCCPKKLQKAFIVCRRFTPPLSIEKLPYMVIFPFLFIFPNPPPFPHFWQDFF